MVGPRTWPREVRDSVQSTAIDSQRLVTINGGVGEED